MRTLCAVANVPGSRGWKFQEVLRPAPGHHVLMSPMSSVTDHVPQIAAFHQAGCRRLQIGGSEPWEMSLQQSYKEHLVLTSGTELGCPSRDLSKEFSSTVPVLSSAVDVDKGQILDEWGPVPPLGPSWAWGWNGHQEQVGGLVKPTRRFLCFVTVKGKWGKRRVALLDLCVTKLSNLTLRLLHEDCR